MAVFKEYSAYYDLLYKDKDYEGEVEYVRGLINKYAGSARTILNLGCGTGKHDYLFAQQGYDVTGIDSSQEMIDIAISKSHDSHQIDNPKFHCNNILTLDLKKKFDIILALFHVMSYQVSNSDLENAFKAALRHLHDNGVFIFDCWYGPGVLTELPHKRERVFEDDNYKIKRISTPVMYAVENSVDVRFNVEISDKNLGKQSTLEEVHKLRYLFNTEIAFLGEKLNFDIIHSETWMSGEALGYSSWNAVFVCRRKP